MDFHCISFSRGLNVSNIAPTEPFSSFHLRNSTIGVDYKTWFPQFSTQNPSQDMTVTQSWNYSFLSVIGVDVGFRTTQGAPGSPNPSESVGLASVINYIKGMSFASKTLIFALPCFSTNQDFGSKFVVHNKRVLSSECENGLFNSDLCLLSDLQGFRGVQKPLTAKKISTFCMCMYPPKTLSDT